MKYFLCDRIMACPIDLEYMHSIFAGISKPDLEVFEKVIMQMTENTK